MAFDQALPGRFQTQASYYHYFEDNHENLT